MLLKCPFCKKKVIIASDDLIKIGREQMKREILELLNNEEKH